jgi:hypothetical protein
LIIKIRRIPPNPNDFIIPRADLTTTTWQQLDNNLTTQSYRKISDEDESGARIRYDIHNMTPSMYGKKNVTE